MKTLITGHRLFKLESYDKDWIQYALLDGITHIRELHGYFRGYSGMASGVDLWFCRHCLDLNIQYVACIPFDGQEETMSEIDAKERSFLIDKASEVRKVKNSWMVEECDMGLVVWDGNKGGTHNVVQQLIEKNKPFYWINPVGKKVWGCT